MHLQVQEDSSKQAETLIALAAGVEQQAGQMRDFEALLEAMQGEFLWPKSTLAPEIELSRFYKCVLEAMQGSWLGLEIHNLVDREL